MSMLAFLFSPIIHFNHNATTRFMGIGWLLSLATIVTSLLMADYGVALLVGLLPLLAIAFAVREITAFQTAARSLPTSMDSVEGKNESIADIEAEFQTKIDALETVLATQKAASDEKYISQKQKMRSDMDRFIKDALVTLSRDIERELIQVVSALNDQTDETANISNEMASIANQVNQKSANAMSATQQALDKSQSVASAIDELNSSIGEVANQISEANRLTQETEDKAEKATLIINRASDAAEKINDVVAIINDIAKKTNMLSLNATIEAARAGEMGKGFSVVANEVKQLANQTATSTESIRSLVLEMQGSVQEAVEAITHIVSQIRMVADSAEVVANTAGQQARVTDEIARNIHQATGSVREVTSEVEGLSSDASASDHVASRMTESYAKIDHQVNGLQAILLELIKQAIRNSENREEVRTSIDPPMKAHFVTEDGRATICGIMDVSEGGAKMLFTHQGQFHKGDIGQLKIDRHDFDLEVTLRWFDDAEAGVSFNDVQMADDYVEFVRENYSLSL